MTEREQGATGYIRGSVVALMVGAMVLLGVLVLVGGADMVRRFGDVAYLVDVMTRVGPWTVVVLLALAVIVSPIPSGPIAMAAGALYGTVEGGALTAAGALIGATVAFALSRGVGYRPLAASTLPGARWITRPRSQARLTLAVLVSRLIPFISFDAVSYVAGLTPIRPRNFVLATAVGVLPASFAFAALGAGMAEMNSVVMMFAALGITLVVPVIVLAVRRLGGRRLHPRQRGLAGAAHCARV